MRVNAEEGFIKEMLLSFREKLFLTWILENMQRIVHELSILNVPIVTIDVRVSELQRRTEHNKRMTQIYSNGRIVKGRDFDFTSFYSLSHTLLFNTDISIKIHTL